VIVPLVCAVPHLRWGCRFVADEKGQQVQGRTVPCGQLSVLVAGVVSAATRAGGGSSAAGARMAVRGVRRDVVSMIRPFRGVGDRCVAGYCTVKLARTTLPALSAVTWTMPWTVAGTDQLYL